MFDKLHEECGVFGIYGHPESANLTYLGLYALQHRGQESAGISVIQDGVLNEHRAMGLVSDAFSMETLERLRGTSAIGHVRYSTTGSSVLANAQPFVVRHSHKAYAVGHNGNIVNAHQLKAELEDSGSIFQSTMDSEIFLHLFVRNLHLGFEKALVEAAARLQGAFSMVVLTSRGEVVGIRDPHGFRPLCLGRLNGHWVLASESCALDLVQAEFVRELDPGEIVIIDAAGPRSLYLPDAGRQSFCIFEFIYFARPDSTLMGRNVYQVRKSHGRRLSQEAPVEADLVMPFPDSGTYAALGYSEASGIPFELGMIRNHYVGRTFIEPDQSIRDFGVKIKLNPARSAIEGKRIVLVDDSIVRGTTAKKIIKMLRHCGAKEIHFRVASPPIINSCYYGIDTPNRGKLIAHNFSVEEIRDFLGVDSLAYLTIPAMLRATGCDTSAFCTACFDNNYPTPTPDQFQPRGIANRHIDHSVDPYGV